MFGPGFVSATLERMVRTFAQSLLALWGADTAFNILQVDVPAALGAAATAAVLSVLTSLVAGKVGPNGPSFGPERLTTGRHGVDGL